MSYDALSYLPTSPLALTITCGIAEVAQQTAILLQQYGFQDAPRAPIEVVLDIPFGFALTAMDTTTASHHIIVTANSCPEYGEDLWELTSAIVLVRPKLNPDITDAIRIAHTGNRYRLPDDNTSTLTSTQRRFLRLVAYGLTDKEIADSCHVQPQTVSNGISAVLKNLGLSNRVEATLYYWDMVETTKIIKLCKNK